jgi:putative transposase
MYSQINRLPELKSSRESLKSVYSQLLQNVAVRVDLAFKAFFRRCKVAGKPGYPRFRGKGRYDSSPIPKVVSVSRRSANSAMAARYFSLR